MLVRIFMIVIGCFCYAIHSFAGHMGEVASPLTTTLISKDDLKLDVPVEVTEQIPSVKQWSEIRGKPVKEDKLWRLSGDGLKAFVQLLQEYYQHKDLTEEQFFNMFEPKITIPDNLELLIAVNYYKFKPGMDFMARKVTEP